MRTESWRYNPGGTGIFVQEESKEFKGSKDKEEIVCYAYNECCWRDGTNAEISFEPSFLNRLPSISNYKVKFTTQRGRGANWNIQVGIITIQALIDAVIHDGCDKDFQITSKTGKLTLDNTLFAVTQARCFEYG